MKSYKGYLIDLDGTMYRGTEQIAEAAGFINDLRKRDIPYLFVTNNSSRTPAQVADKLRSIGISTEDDQVFTTSMATANYIAEQKKGASVYVVGEEGIIEALKEKGMKLVEEHPDYLVMGIDRGINYEKLSKACLAVRNGAVFISTNGDIAIPTEQGLLPGNGSLTSVVSVSTQVQPIFIGKPESVIVEQALRVLGVPKEETIMVGDNYDTDILAGINAGIDTLLVHTGVTTKERLKQYKEQPTHVVDTLDLWRFE
ncbi:TIGR01457 family HAD-type hydrolase [Peribacillus frigoritolerans]|jgi:4-nitrophenyl phosphatase|uniref:TIGR01457 family HAD-type hydrolase n=1 Tax=Peribacillus TaxID=2675229 RepID=UPI00055037E0|nr:TIGR01457 family HAD-type hydrolase [Peribacillus frigoritolerans]KRF50657.1 HAD family hydrolase [Bacillus sp. Soil745]MBD8137038.1 TIGR01457 family HAD-type hydrolase [Bacillus sp. CFBP 13597]MBT2602807.1 TIGR01457 family HAD-type hydrolase [Bacillus sp. ISL-53]MDP9738602.1 4-nitrophenyl phosphatase [Bacillus sp. B2I3]PAW28468.1 HAD family hydrolase [Peribacillus simplex]PEF37221.1 TIGR01457 family HAD-type hydrolase [Bacillus sp. AFS094228]PEO48563.1 TIGR01457 family HAD-type hydrolase